MDFLESNLKDLINELETTQSTESSFSCERCADSGFIYRDGETVYCPYCKSRAPLVEISPSTIANEVASIRIPEAFRNLTFDKGKLLNYYDDDGVKNLVPNEIRMQSEFKSYVDYLDGLYGRFLVGQKIKRSLLVSAPIGYGKKHFVYASLNSAIKAGLSVAPYLDTMEIYGLIKLVSKNDRVMKTPEERMEHQQKLADLERIFSADVCFVKIFDGLVTNRDTQTLKVLVDRRSRRDLPTIVISRFPPWYLRTIEDNIDAFLNAQTAEGDYSKLYNIAAPTPKKEYHRKDYTKKN